MIIGQEQLLTKINTYNINTLPHSIIIEGLIGSGKHTIADYICTKFNLNKFILTEKIDYNVVDEMLSATIPTAYIIDDSLLSPSGSSKLLKAIEEPSDATFNIILTVDHTTLSEAILSRCQLFVLDDYTNEQLINFYNPVFNFGDPKVQQDLTFIFSKTPGQISVCQNLPLYKMYKMAAYVAKNASNLTFGSLLNLTDSFYYTNSYENSSASSDKAIYPILLFAKMLLHYTRLMVEQNNYDEKFSKKYILTNQFCYDIINKSYNKKYLFETYLIKLKGINNEKEI